MFFDRLSTSEPLFVELLQEPYFCYATGTAKGDKKGKKFGSLSGVKLQERGQHQHAVRLLGSVTGRQNDVLFAAIWYDVKPDCLFLSTGTPPGEFKVLRRVGGGPKQEFSAPTASLIFQTVYAHSSCS